MMAANSMKAYEYLIGKYGSEDEAKGEVEKYRAKFGEACAFEAAVLIKAQEHGWKNPVRPSVPYVCHLTDEWLEDCVKYKVYNGKETGMTDMEGEIVSIGPIMENVIDTRNGPLTLYSLTVRIKDEGFERNIRMQDRDPFKSKDGTDYKGSYMMTLFDNLRAAVGKRVKISGVQVRRVEGIDGVKHYIESCNFTDATLVRDPHEPDVENIEHDEDEEFDF